MKQLRRQLIPYGALGGAALVLSFTLFALLVAGVVGAEEATPPSLPKDWQFHLPKGDVEAGEAAGQHMNLRAGGAGEHQQQNG